MKTALKGYTSPETAFVVDDYPYGFTLRTKIRFWVETKGKSGCGQRFCSQTLNPKTNQWNKPKCRTYAVIVGMYKDDKDYVQYETLSSGGWSKEESIQNFEALYAPLSEYEVKAIRYIRATNKANEVIKFDVKPASDDSKPQTKEEQEEIWNKALSWGYSQTK